MLAVVGNDPYIIYLWVGIVIAVGGVMFGAFRLINKHIAKPLRTLTGTEASPGVLAIPSLVEQVQQIRDSQVKQDVAQEAQDKVLETQTLQLMQLQREMTSNGGDSLRDRVDRVDHNITQMSGDVTTLKTDVVELKEDVSGLKKTSKKKPKDA